MSEIPDGFQPAQFNGPYLQRGGPYYVRTVGDCYEVGLRVGDGHINYIDIAHGGVLSTLADVALSFQVYLSERPNPAVTTVSLTTNFLAPARLGDWLVATTKIDRLGKRSAHVSGSICCGEQTLATMSGVFNVRRAVSAGDKR
ncbi:PaaI family thioesterase [Candidatus Litorirhabdus singularis]|nr:PaaI family thioesterase [Candidatus Litorirhabdus singularis]